MAKVEVAYLDSAYRLLPDGREGLEAVERLEEDTVDRAAVYSRRVIEVALRRGAARRRSSWPTTTPTAT